MYFEFQRRVVPKYLIHFDTKPDHRRRVGHLTSSGIAKPQLAPEEKSLDRPAPLSADFKTNLRNVKANSGSFSNTAW